MPNEVQTEQHFKFTIISVIGTVKLDNGSIVDGSARKSYLAMLHPLHHQGLGAFMAS